MKKIMYMFLILLISMSVVGCGPSKKEASEKMMQNMAENLDEAISHNPQNATPYIYRAKLRMNNEDFEGALDDAESALQIEPDNQMALAIKARSQHEIDK